MVEVRSSSLLGSTYAGLAQLVERRVYTAVVGGSNPSACIMDTTPKTSHRWILMSDDIDAFLLQKIKLPIWTAKAGEAKFLTPLELDMFDPIAPNAAQAIMEAGIKSSRDPLNLTIKLLDSVGNVVSRWKILCQILDVDFGVLDYNVSDPIIIKARFEVLKMTVA